MAYNRQIEDMIRERGIEIDHGAINDLISNGGQEIREYLDEIQVELQIDQAKTGSVNDHHDVFHDYTMRCMDLNANIATAIRTKGLFSRVKTGNSPASLRDPDDFDLLIVLDVFLYQECGADVVEQFSIGIDCRDSENQEMKCWIGDNPDMWFNSGPGITPIAVSSRAWTAARMQTGQKMAEALLDVAATGINPDEYQPPLMDLEFDFS